MKIFLSLLALVFIVSCKSKTENAEENTWTEDPNAVENAEGKANDDLNTLVPDTEDEEEMMLLGKINRQGLEQEAFKAWFDENFKAHTIDTTTVLAIEPHLEMVDIKVFMGSWCEDSQREVPALYKILEMLSFDEKNLDVIAVSHDKDTPQGYEKDLNIEYVPTIIFYKNGKELGRFVEYAQESLEKDILAIVSGADYKHAYAE